MSDKVSIFDDVVAGTTMREEPPSKIFKSRRRRIETVGVDIIAKWAIDSVADTCAICRENLVNLCLKCQTDNYTTDCLVAEGDCNHVYHSHCISNWLKTKQNNCPLCSKKWQMVSVSKFT